MTENAKPFNSARLVAAIAIFCVWSIAIAARLVQFQVFQREKLSALADTIQKKQKSIPALRGFIYDSNMAELSISMMVSNIYAEPAKMKDIRATAAKLAPLLNVEPKLLTNLMAGTGRNRRMAIAKRVGPDIAQQIRDLGLIGIELEDEQLRAYPNRNLASPVLGFINKAGEGVAGLEYRYNNELQGKQGKIVYDVDAFGRSFNQTILDPPVPGQSLVLCIDRSIQHITQRELAAGVKRFHAKAGVAIVMDSESGRILALASYPDFDCNAPGNDQNSWRNRAIQDTFEPGSTFKVVVAATTLDANLVKANESIDCRMGAMKIGDRTIHDHEHYGLLTFPEVLEYSSNIGSARLGLRLGAKRLYEALGNFGFGSMTGIDLPAERTGRVRHWKNWSDLAIATVSFGQGVAVTSMQMLVAINAVANGGYHVQPFIVEKIINEKGETVRTHSPRRTQIMHANTAAVVTDAFEGVIQHGTGTLAALEGYRAAGKTATAQKVEFKRYSKTKYVASFIGFAPLPQPRVSILVQIDEPQGKIYGREVAAPIFQKIAQETLLKLQVPPDKSLLSAETKAAFRPSASDRTSQFAD
jgi:cell division protein FtsI (penicillin-binding protein 3)